MPGDLTRDISSSWPRTLISTSPSPLLHCIAECSEVLNKYAYNMASPNGSIVDEHVRGDDENASGNERPRKMARVSTREEEGPSCSSCRRRKTKCSRDQPCSNCSKIGTSLLRLSSAIVSKLTNLCSGASCVYDGGKMKPGLRTGAVESLSQRLSMPCPISSALSSSLTCHFSRPRKHVCWTRHHVAADVECHLRQ
jgi:hypothetical protein